MLMCTQNILFIESFCFSTFYTSEEAWFMIYKSIFSGLAIIDFIKLCAGVRASKSSFIQAERAANGMKNPPPTIES